MTLPTIIGGGLIVLGIAIFVGWIITNALNDSRGDGT